jgi:hypothetical protein
MKQISKRELTEDVNVKGMKREDLMVKYELNKFNLSAILKEAGLKIKKEFKKKYSLIDDLSDVTADVTIN